MKTYIVRLASEGAVPVVDPKEWSRIAALYLGYTYVWVRADSAEYAVTKAQAMVPWRLVNSFSATEMLPGDVI